MVYKCINWRFAEALWLRTTDGECKKKNITGIAKILIFICFNLAAFSLQAHLHLPHFTCQNPISNQKTEPGLDTHLFILRQSHTLHNAEQNMCVEPTSAGFRSGLVCWFSGPALQ